MEPDQYARIPLGVGALSLLDTDLCKLTMQAAVLEYFPNVPVAYELTNRTPAKKFSRAAFRWLEEEIDHLDALTLDEDELVFLREACPFLKPAYLGFLRTLRLNPKEHVFLDFDPNDGAESSEELGSLRLVVKGPWAQAISYEVPLLVLVCEAYFRFMDTDWTHEGQEEKAFRKGMTLLEAGCNFAEYGARRRRDCLTQVLVLRGLVRAKERGYELGLSGSFSGTSNVRLAKKFGLKPMGTVGHEWFMGVAAVVDDYRTSTALALRYWLDCFGEGIWKVVPTDTFGTPAFLESFAQPMETTSRSSPRRDGLSPARVESPRLAPRSDSFAEAFGGVRQDSGDPEIFIGLMRDFYDKVGISGDKTLVFSDSLNDDLCIKLKEMSEAAGFKSAFGIGTFFTNDFTACITGKKSTPLNVVIKLASAAGRPAVKITDAAGKNAGDIATIQRVKRELGYKETEWEGDDESRRWGE
ncbi:hypothetical protein INS49_010688 [Diaporthe citri]|uniref:uncharacterized protein n=1 Tax=Diaporthe citri TaxID=83186 RepID=UPI001C826707|nr:uncharacterized protein INS49_010688 [Diaporthe citri]KAG6362458.1 hypothetical protein INS49_010688 [Diaporthe citri]